MIIDTDIKSIVNQIETKNVTVSELDVLIKRLIQKLQSNCRKEKVRQRYESYHSAVGALEPYPLDSEGYAVAFDPLEDEEAFYGCWGKYGIIVGKKVADQPLREDVIARIQEMLSALSNGHFDLRDKTTWGNIPRDGDGIPILSRGFFEVYHDKSLADLRQSIRLYIHHVVIWGRTDLWTSFDRLGVKFPKHEESKGLPLHVDQNPNVHPYFKTLQGVLALSDCPVERGTYVGVPGSKRYFSEYAEMAEGMGEYVELDLPNTIAPLLQKNAQAIPLRAGDIVSWDSRTTHANSDNTSEDVRLVAYIAAGPARADNPDLMKERDQAFREAGGKNARDALMHASKPPRYTNPNELQRIREPEDLTLLGKLLYGQASYETL